LRPGERVDRSDQLVALLNVNARGESEENDADERDAPDHSGQNKLPVRRWRP
jgi:hypothetical protein